MAGPRMKSQPFTHTGVTQYLQLASLLRHQILRGELREGDQLPTVAQLAEQYGVARVTARQAYGVLGRDGLVRSQRGRGTFVAQALASASAPRLRQAINDPSTEDVRFHILEQREEALPPALARQDAIYPSYAFVRKIHLHDGEPFCLAEIHVAAEIHARFPADAEQHRKIAYLLHEYATVPLATVQQTTTVAPASTVLAEQLACPFTTPIAHMVRRVFDRSGRLVLAGLFWYRGDRFVVDVEIPFDVWLGYRGVGMPGALPSTEVAPVP